MSRSRQLSLTAALVGLAAALGAPAPAAAQGTGVVAGTVVDSATRRPIEGAQVLMVGSTRGTLTSPEGTYVLRGVRAGTATLRVLRIGYGAQSRAVAIAASDSVTADFALRAVAQQLSEVVVTGYGTEQQRRDVSSAVSTVSSNELQGAPVAGVDLALQGKAPGLQVIQNAGNPGNGITVRVRGSASLSASNQPLYVIDGVPMIRENFSQLDVGGQDITAVTGISPDEVASIDILKDAAAAAIYGSRASNGVVLITTKRGQAGTTLKPAKIAFSAYSGWQEVSKTVPMMSAREYVDYMFDAVMQDCKIDPDSYCDGARTQAEMEASAADQLGFSRNIPDSVNTDWQAAAFKTAPVYDMNLNVNGGTERIQYFVSGAYFEQQGIVIGSRYNRENVRANLDFRASNRLQFRTSIGLIREDHDRNENDNTIDGVVTNAIAEQPIFPVKLPSGDFTSTDDGLEYGNPIAIGRLDAAESRTFRSIGSIEGEYNFTDWLKLTSHVGADVLNLRDLRWFSPKILGRYAASVSGVAQQGNNTAQRYLIENYATVDRALGGVGRATLLGGGSVEYNNSELQFMQGEGFGSEDFRYPGNAGKITDYRGAPRDYNLVSFFSRANLALRDRYFLTASLREDGSSRFGKNNRWGLFPAVSLGWILTDEGFMAPLRRFGGLKLRASYGLTGNQGITDNYAPLARYGKANYSDEPGIAPSSLGNPDLKWESTRELDLGFDIFLLNSRVSILGDYYQKKTNDLLVFRPITATSGFTNLWSNIGNIENTGYELAINTVNFQPRSADGFRWATDFNISWNHNEVTELFQHEPFNSGIRSVNRVEEGAPLGAFHTLIFEGVDPNTGDAKYRDLNGDGQINSDDRAIVGSPHPTYWGGFTNTISWKGFDLRGFLQFSHGAEVYNAMRIFSDDGGYYNDNKFRNALNRWQKPGDVTKEPRPSWNGLSNAREVSSRYIEDGSYVRLQEVTLGYRIPARFARVGYFQDAQLFVSGRNLKTWTDYSGYNPDVNSLGSSANVSLGTDFYAYPVARTFQVGIRGAW